MAILPKCKSCKRTGRYTKNSNDQVCSKCFQEGKAQKIVVKKNNK